MRNHYYSRKTRHIVKFSSLFVATLLNCAPSFADDVSDKIKVAIPQADSTTFVYNGSLQAYSLAEDTTHYTILGDKHTSAGEYEVTVALNNVALFVNTKATVGISVKSNAAVETVFKNKFGKTFNVG